MQSSVLTLLLCVLGSESVRLYALLHEKAGICSFRSLRMRARRRPYGAAVLNHIIRPETPYMRVRDDLDIDEFCADEAHCRSGIGTELMTFIRSYAKKRALRKSNSIWGIQ